MKKLLCCIAGASILGAIIFGQTPGLDYIAKSNGATNSAAYLVKLQADLEAQGRNGMQQALYDEGNARSRTLATVHPRTRKAILYLLQLDSWIPDGSGTKPPDFDPSIADDRINNLGTYVP
jgi:hypothetical protein